MSYYSKQWSSATPGYLIFLVDQSWSMSKTWMEEKSFAEFTADVINQTINELIATNAAGETVKNRIFISLIGYCGDDTITDIRSDYISNYADYPIRVDKHSKEVSDGAGGTLTLQVEIPIFLEPVTVGYTPMGRAFEFAKKLIEVWIHKKNDNPAPVVINVSDGHPQPTEEIDKTIRAANEIMQVQTLDGSPLIFNVHIGEEKGREIQFPENQSELYGDSMAEFLYKISCKVPDVYKKAAKDYDLGNLGDNAKGFISNASPESLIKFINFGSSGGIDRTSV